MHHTMSRLLTLAAICLGSLATASANADITMTEVDLVGNRIEIINTGSMAVDLSNYWLCNRVNGSPFYQTFGAGATAGTLTVSGLSTEAAGVSDGFTNLEAGDVLVLEIDPDFLPDANGELGIYNTNSFGSSAAIEDYVLWGANGVRDSVAQAAGIWTDNTALSVAGIDANNTFTLDLTTGGNSPADYQVAAASLGSVSVVPEPSSLTILGLFSGAALLRRRRN